MDEKRKRVTIIVRSKTIEKYLEIVKRLKGCSVKEVARGFGISTDLVYKARGFSMDQEARYWRDKWMESQRMLRLWMEVTRCPTKVKPKDATFIMPNRKGRSRRVLSKSLTKRAREKV